MEKQLEIPKMEEEETKYISDVKKRLELARDARNQTHDEFDGQSYTQYFESNEKGANTYIEPKKNKYDSNFQSGTIRNKLVPVVSNIANLNLSPDISAHDKDNVLINKLGNGMEHIIYETEEIEGDEEKKIERIWELIKQGDVFVEEIWQEKWVKEKKMKKKFDGKLNAEWNEKLRKDLPQPERNIISGLGVYLGDIRQPYIGKQPYIFTVEVMPYVNAKQIFGEWDRWKYVPKKIVRNEHTQEDQDVLYGWNITEVEDDSVEIIKYQDKPNNEYAIFINGILMTPKGLPFQWGWDDYNIVQQGLENITPTFAYHKSMVARMKTDVALKDEIIRLAVLLTKKAADPARANLSGRVLSEKTFMPSVYTKGLNPNQVPLMDPNGSQGVTNPMLAMIEKIDQTINEQSVNPSYAGQEGEAEKTATQYMGDMKQAQASIGLMITKCGILEWKLSWLRLYNILNNWFEPIDTVVDDVRNELKNKYRTVNRETPIEGEGQGRTMVIPTEETISSQDIYDKEEELKKKTGSPTRIIYLNPKLIKRLKYIWSIAIRPREKTTSELGKLMVRNFLDGLAMFPNTNWDEASKDYAEAWDKDPAKYFMQNQSAMPNEATPTGSGSSKNIPETRNIIQPPKGKVI